MLLAGVWFFAHGRGLTFYYDEWAFVMGRRDWTAHALLHPHNEHLVLVPGFVFKVLFATVGLDAYWAYRIVGIVAHLAVVGLVFALARRRIGDVLALVAAIPLLFLGSGAQNILWPFQIAVLGSLAAGLGALLMIERRDLRGDLAAAVLLTFALASFSLGIPFGLALLVHVLWRPPRLRRVWVVAAPIALYALWALEYGRGELARGNVFRAPRFVAETAAASFGGLTGLRIEWGRPILLLAALGLAVFVVRHGLSPRLAALLAGAGSFWFLTAVARAHMGGEDAGRYVYVGAVFIVLIAAEVATGLVVPPRAVAVMGLLVAVSLAANYDLMRTELRHLREFSGAVTASLMGLELAGRDTAPLFYPEPVRAPDVYAGGYFAATAAYGSPAASLDEVLERPDEEREVADSTYVGASGVQPEPVARADADGPALEVVSARSGRVEQRRGCVGFTPTGDEAELEIVVPSSAFVVAVEDNAPVRVHVRLLADGYEDDPAARVPGESTMRIALPDPVANRRWHARLSGTERVEVCPAARR